MTKKSMFMVIHIPYIILYVLYYKPHSYQGLNPDAQDDNLSPYNLPVHDLNQTTYMYYSEYR